MRGNKNRQKQLAALPNTSNPPCTVRQRKTIDAMITLIGVLARKESTINSRMLEPCPVPWM